MFQNLYIAPSVAKIQGISCLSVIFSFSNDKDGVPIKTKEALVVYVPLKKMKQFITKKNSMSVDIDMRDQKTGLLISDDKNGKTSDREFEALTVMGLTQTVRELSRPRADSMKSKSVMYNTINTVGKVNLTELPDEPDDVLSKNMLNVYLIGSGLDSNLLNTDGYLPITLKDKQHITRCGEMADAQDLKSWEGNTSCRFDPDHRDH